MKNKNNFNERLNIIQRQMDIIFGELYGKGRSPLRMMRNGQVIKEAVKEWMDENAGSVIHDHDICKFVGYYTDFYELYRHYPIAVPGQYAYVENNGIHKFVFLSEWEDNGMIGVDDKFTVESTSTVEGYYVGKCNLESLISITPSDNAIMEVIDNCYPYYIGKDGVWCPIDNDVQIIFE